MMMECCPNIILQARMLCAENTIAFASKDILYESIMKMER